MTYQRVRHIALVALLLVILPTVLACGGPAAPGGNAAPTRALAQPAEEPTSAPEPAAGEAEPNEPAPQSGDPMARVTGALSLLQGSEETPSVFSSYHIEINSTSPSWDDEADEVKIRTSEIKADVEGDKVHLITSEGSGDDAETSEGYLVGEEQYEVVDGQVQESLWLGLSWAMWPLEPTIILSLAATGTSPAGSEAIDGRTADAFTVDMANADPAVLEAIQGFIGKGVTVAKGQVWVDQETGALLKMVLDFEQDLTLPGEEEVKGHGAGHIEIAVSQVNSVTVEVPEA